MESRDASGGKGNGLKSLTETPYRVVVVVVEVMGSSLLKDTL